MLTNNTNKDSITSSSSSSFHSSDSFTISTDHIDSTITYTDNTATSYGNTITLGTATVPTFTTTTYTTISADPFITSTINCPLDKKEIQIPPINKKIDNHLIKARKTHIYFSNIKEYVPNKVYEFTIKDNFSREPFTCKTICDDNDEFNLEMAFYIALSKKEYPRLTPEGHVYYANLMKYDKKYIKIVKHGMQLFKLLQEEEEYNKQEKECIKLRHEKYVKKKMNRKIRKKEQEQKDLYNTIKKAIEDTK